MAVHHSAWPRMTVHDGRAWPHMGRSTTVRGRARPRKATHGRAWPQQQSQSQTANGGPPWGPGSKGAANPSREHGIAAQQTTPGSLIPAGHCAHQGIGHSLGERRRPAGGTAWAGRDHMVLVLPTHTAVVLTDGAKHARAWLDRAGLGRSRGRDADIRKHGSWGTTGGARTRLDLTAEAPRPGRWNIGRLPNT